MNPRRFLRAVLPLGFAALALASVASAQCVMCGTVGQGKSDPLVKGMYYSVLTMVSMPFAVVAALGGWFAYKFKHGEPDGEGPPGDDARDDERHDGPGPDARVGEEHRVIPFRRD